MSRAERNRILQEIESLAPEQRQLLLAVARALVGRRGGSARGEALLGIAGSIRKRELARMSAAIEEGCETIDPGGW